jgi:hypothetical protein
MLFPPDVSKTLREATQSAPRRAALALSPGCLATGDQKPTYMPPNKPRQLRRHVSRSKWRPRQGSPAWSCSRRRPTCSGTVATGQAGAIFPPGNSARSRSPRDSESRALGRT